MKHKNLKLYFSLLILLLFFSIICYKNSNIFGANSVTTNNEISNQLIEPKEISIVAAGDILIHGPQIKSGYDSKSNTYNFDNFFSNVKDYIESADLAVCNSETSYLGAGSEYTGYPSFNSPNELLSSIKECGFDVLASAHNHTLDKGAKGFINTAKAITDTGLDLIGLKNNEEDKNYIIKDVNGIKIGLTNYTYSELDKSGTRSLNGIPIPKNLINKINVFSENNLDSDLITMNETYDNMINDGAEFVIFYIHWGNEYQHTPSAVQEKIAKKLNTYGIDAIIGSHPHVVQPVRTIKNDATNKETLVCYSLGNFISNQRKETIGNVRSEDGLMVKLIVSKDKDNNVSLKSYETNPTWVNKYTDNNGKIKYTILPIEDTLKEDSAVFSNSVINKMKDSYNATQSTINS